MQLEDGANRTSLQGQTRSIAPSGRCSSNKIVSAKVHTTSTAVPRNGHLSFPQLNIARPGPGGKAATERPCTQTLLHPGLPVGFRARGVGGRPPWPFLLPAAALGASVLRLAPLLSWVKRGKDTSEVERAPPPSPREEGRFLPCDLYHLGPGQALGSTCQGVLRPRGACFCMHWGEKC